MKKTLLGYLFSALVCTLAAVPPALAQYNAGFEGLVSDASGAVIPEVKVVARNTATGVEYPATSNSAGVYHITDLPQGTYKITAEKTGFTTAQTDELDLHTEELKGVNLTLAVGSVKQTVNVSDNAPLINTEQARLSKDINFETMNNLPLEGENPLSVVALTPGVTGSSPGNSTIFSVANSVSVNANGLQSSSNNYKVDGTTVTETPNGGTMNISPDLDEVAEIHVTTNNFSAETGRSGGFQLDMSTKSGTNHIHGDAFYYGITARLNANSFFSNSVGSPTGGNAYKPRFDQNIFGGTVGGPIRKDKAFFFASYSGLREVGGPSATTGSPVAVETVETQAFEQYVEANYPNSIAAQLFSKFPPTVFPQFDITTAANYSPGFYTSNTAFPAGLPVGGNAVFSFPTYSNGDHYLTRVDYNVREQDRVYGSFMQTYLKSPQPYARIAFEYPYPEGDSFLSLSWDHTFGSNMINEVKGGFSRTGAFVPGVQPDIPQISLNDGIQGFGINGSIPFGFFQMNYEWKDILTRYQGKHNMKMGVEFRRGHDDFESVSRPAYDFQNILDFATDKPLNESLSVDAVSGLPRGPGYQERTFETAAFFQDDYKVTSRLTLNLGLRWEDYRHPTEVFGQFANFIPGSGSDYDERIASGSMQLTPAPWSSKNLNFAPRLGLSWNPKTRLVIRSGFGITYDRFANGNWEGLADNPPKGPVTVTAGYPSNQTPFTYQLGGPGAYYGFTPNPAFATGLNAQNGINGVRSTVSGAVSNLAEPYVENWFQGVQYELSKNWMIEADYLGNEAHHLIWNRDINRFAGDLIENGGSFTGFNPAFQNITLMFSDGNSSYNAFVFHVRRQMANSFSFDAVYTYSKAIDDNEADAQILTDLTLEKGLSSFDHPQRFTSYATWRTPSLADSNAYLRAIAGGWEASPIIVIQSGAPFTVSCGLGFNYGISGETVTDTGGCNWVADGDGGVASRPNAPAFGSKRIPGVNFQSWINGAFGPNPFSTFPAPALGTVGSLGRDTYFGPGMATVDFSIHKNFGIYGEKLKLQFRADAFNLFNRVNLSGVDGGMQDGTFGHATGTLNPREIQLGAKLLF
jgi:hypothetical protein